MSNTGRNVGASQSRWAETARFCSFSARAVAGRVRGNSVQDGPKVSALSGAALGDRFFRLDGVPQLCLIHLRLGRL